MKLNALLAIILLAGLLVTRPVSSQQAPPLGTPYAVTATPRPTVVPPKAPGSRIWLPIINR